MKIDKEKLQRYAELKSLISKYEAEIDELNPLIKAEMEESETDEINSDFGKFYFKKRRSWEYPESVVKLEEDYKKAKKESEQLGTATYVENNILTFTTKKNEDA